MQRVLRWLSRRPLWLLHAIGAALGWLTYALSPTYRRRVRSNAALAGISAAARRGAVAEAGRALLELPYLWLRAPDAPISPPVRVEGAALIDAAHAAGRGIVFLTPHMGCFEVTAQAYAERYAAAHGPVTVLYRPARKAWLREVVDTSRSRPGLATAPATLAGVRQMIRALRRGEAVGLLPDQVPPEGLGVWAPFFGQKAYTMTLAARLVQQTGATPLDRLGRAIGAWTGLRRAPLGSGRTAAGRRCAGRGQCRQSRDGGADPACPQQYLWGYNRYKGPRQEVDPRASSG